jgi:ribosomal protein L44E
MKFPKEINAYCPHCRKHVKMKVKIASKGKARSMAIGNRKHERSLLGHGGKKAEAYAYLPKLQQEDAPRAQGKDQEKGGDTEVIGWQANSL